MITTIANISAIIIFAGFAALALFSPSEKTLEEINGKMKESQAF